MRACQLPVMIITALIQHAPFAQGYFPLAINCLICATANEIQR
jgi:hypothetical protein